MKVGKKREKNEILDYI